MKVTYLSLIGLLLFLYSCNKDSTVPVPSQVNSIIKETNPLLPQSKLFMEGVYKVTSGSVMFGDYMVV